jgi:hypothetical protein
MRTCACVQELCLDGENEPEEDEKSELLPHCVPVGEGLVQDGDETETSESDLQVEFCDLRRGVPSALFPSWPACMWMPAGPAKNGRKKWLSSWQTKSKEITSNQRRGDFLFLPLAGRGSWPKLMLERKLNEFWRLCSSSGGVSNDEPSSCALFCIAFMTAAPDPRSGEAWAPALAIGATDSPTSPGTACLDPGTAASVSAWRSFLDFLSNEGADCSKDILVKKRRDFCFVIGEMNWQAAMLRDLVHAPVVVLTLDAGGSELKRSSLISGRPSLLVLCDFSILGGSSESGGSSSHSPSPVVVLTPVSMFPDFSTCIEASISGTFGRW